MQLQALSTYETFSWAPRNTVRRDNDFDDRVQGNAPWSRNRATTAPEVKSVPQQAPGWRESLYLEMQPLVRKLVRKYADCRDTREDLAGDLYFRFCSLLDEFEPERGIPLKGYLIRQLCAAAYTHARTRWRHRRHEASLDYLPHLLDAHCGPDPSKEWNDRIDNEAVLVHLRNEIAGLPLRQRQVLIARYYEDRSFEEISGAMEIEQATARSLLRHALQNLRKRISPALALELA